jgi:O-methyltransferase domain
VAPIFEKYVAAHGLTERLRFHPGDFFKDSLPEADVLVMGHILHDWGLHEKKLLLHKAHDALPTGGASSCMTASSTTTAAPTRSGSS